MMDRSCYIDVRNLHGQGLSSDTVHPDTVLVAENALMYTAW